MPPRHDTLRYAEEASLKTPGTSSSPGRRQSRWEWFQEKTGIRTTWWELTLTLAGALLIVGLLGWGIKGWVEMQLEAAAVIAGGAAPLESLSPLAPETRSTTHRFG